MTGRKSLQFGPLPPRSMHLCIDMQNLFSEDTEWHTPWMKRVLPVVEEIARHHAERTVFTRFIPARTQDEASGSWRRYYERWPQMTLVHLDRRLLELIPSLARLAPPAVVIDKRVYSPFMQPALLNMIRQRRIDAIVISGAETDVCVLAAVMSAVDLGFRVILAADALCSSSDATHDALLTLYNRRFSQQIEIADAETILAAWQS